MQPVLRLSEDNQIVVVSANPMSQGNIVTICKVKTNMKTSIEFGLLLFRTQTKCVMFIVNVTLVGNKNRYLISGIRNSGIQLSIKP